MNQKNIILIVIDALRADHLGCYDYKRNTSPNLDKLAKENILFKWAFSTISYTCPSFASILTSLYPSHHSIGFHQKFPRLDKDKDVLISEVLKSLNLSTIAVIGSMPLRKEVGLNSGFDIYDVDIPEGRRSAEEINEKFFNWLDNNYKNDFFALIHYFDTHLPFKPPQPYDKEFFNDDYYGNAKYLDVISDGWGDEGDIPQIGGIPRSAVLMNDNNIEKDIRYYISQYDGCIKYVDNAISALIEKLEKLNIYDDCLLIITADHGEAMGENNVWFYHSLTVTPDQIHVPLIMKFPKDHALNPRIYYDHVSLIDIMPTILDMIEFDFKDLSLQGKSLLKLIEQGYDREIEERTIIAENEGQIATIDRKTIEIRPKHVDKSKLVFLYVEGLCNKEMTFNYRDNKKMLEWTGERFLPWIVGAQIHYEHFHRYAFAAQFVKGKKVLDLPCGEGYGSNILSKEAEYVSGIDIDETTINHARNKYTTRNIEFIQGSILDIPIQKNEKFDVIVCFEGIEHIEDHEKFLSEVKRLLKKDGLFIISTPNKEKYSDEVHFNNPFHKKELYFHDFVKLLNNHFMNSLFFGQKVYGSSNIWPLTQDFHSGYKEFVIEKNDNEFILSESGKKNPLYYIAISSDKKLNKDYFTDSTLIDASDSLIKDLEKQISGLSGAIQAKDVQIQIREAQVTELSSVIQAKDTQIAELSNVIQTMDFQLTELKSVIQTKDAQLTELKSVIQTKDAQLTELNSAIQSGNTQIAYLSGSLQSMQESIVWRILMWYHNNLVERTLPHGTKRRKLYDTALKIMFRRKDEEIFGIKNFLYCKIPNFVYKQYKNKLKKYIPSFIFRYIEKLRIAFLMHIRNSTKKSDPKFMRWWNKQVNKMKKEAKIILFVDRNIPTFDRDAGSFIAYQYLIILAKLGYNIIFWPYDLRNMEPYSSDIKSNKIEIVTGNISYYEFLREFGKQIDYIFLSRPSIAHEYIGISKEFSSAKIIYIGHDLHFMREKRAEEITSKKSSYQDTKKIEENIMLNADISLFFSDKEVDIINNEFERINAKVIPWIQELHITDGGLNSERKEMLFLGGFKHMPNLDAMIWFKDEIFPLVKKSIPSAHLTIIGSDPTEELFKMKNDDCTITGYVEESKLSDIFRKARVFVAPLRYGAGFKGKIAKAMSFGVPVVTTTIGSEGIGLEDGKTAMITNNPIEFAEKIIQLYKEDSIWQNMSTNAADHLRNNFSFENAMNKIKDFLN